MTRLFIRFVKDEFGATAIEYGFIAAGIALAIIAVVNGLGTTLNTKFTVDQQFAQVSRSEQVRLQTQPARRSLPAGFFFHWRSLFSFRFPAGGPCD